MKNIVAIVGRPNVGKSALFNRLCQKRIAIVDSQEGVTRDRKYQEIDWNNKTFALVDTGGIIPKSQNQITQSIKFQAQIAIEEADEIIFLVDAQVGTTDYDMEIAKILYNYRQKVILVANKVDSHHQSQELYDFLQLGFGKAYPISAIHGQNIGDLLDKVTESFEDKKEFQSNENEIRIAIVGKPNVGKSLLTNKLFGKDKQIVDNEPGTTRDAIDLHYPYKNKELIFIDTAGLRRKKNIKEGVEYYSSMRTIESINKSDIVLLILDITQKISKQDKKIASYAIRNYKDIVIIYNKWDLIKKGYKDTKLYEENIKFYFPFAQFAPIMFVSALTGKRVNKIFDKILEVEEISQKRIPTSRLNEFIKKITTKFPPSHSSGEHSKIYYATQVKTHPPTFVIFCNKPSLITTHYRRYIENQLRDSFDFEGTTIKIIFRGK